MPNVAQLVRDADQQDRRTRCAGSRSVRQPGVYWEQLRALIANAGEEAQEQQFCGGRIDVDRHQSRAGESVGASKAWADTCQSTASAASMTNRRPAERPENLTDRRVSPATGAVAPDREVHRDQYCLETK